MCFFSEWLQNKRIKVFSVPKVSNVGLNALCRSTHLAHIKLFRLTRFEHSVLLLSSSCLGVAPLDSLS